MFRVLHLVRRRDGMSLEEFESYWRDVHVPITLAHDLILEYRVGLVRELVEAPDLEFDGYAILGYADREAWEADGRTPESLVSRDDVPNFLASNRSLVIEETWYRASSSAGAAK